MKKSKEDGCLNANHHWEKKPPLNIRVKEQLQLPTLIFLSSRIELTLKST